MRFYFFILTVFLFMHAQAQIPTVSIGKLIHYSNIGEGNSLSRPLDVWLPPNYDSNLRYPVLYMQDGQMLFDATTTWNHQSWQVAETISELISQQKIKPMIVVGVWNSGAGRHADYFPQASYDNLTERDQSKIESSKRPDGSTVFQGMEIRSDAYLDYLVHTVKAFVDKQYPTIPDRAHSFIAGSSMGGLISLYALCKYPDVFGGAACLSTHWPGIFQTEDNPFPESMFRYLKSQLPDPATHKIYFDLGTNTLDSMYAYYQETVDGIMKIKGYSASNWMTKTFKGDDHSERSWARRLHIPLEFLLHE